MPSLKHKWIVWSIAAAALSIGSTVAILQSQPPRFEDRFHRVVTLTDRKSAPLDSAVWLDNDTLLVVNDNAGTSSSEESAGESTATPHVIRRLTLSTRTLVVDRRLMSTIDTNDIGNNGWAGASPDGKSIIFNYTPSNDRNADVVRIVSLSDGHVISTDKRPYVQRLFAWLPDSRHWVEVTQHSMTTHDIVHPSIVQHTPVALPVNSHPDPVNADGTFPVEDATLSDGGWGGVHGATSSGRVLVEGSLIDLTANPVTGSHAFNLMPDVVAPKPQDTFFSTRDPWGCLGYTMCPERKLAAYVMFDGGGGQRKKWVPSWWPIASKPSFSIWVSDLSGRRPRLLATLEASTPPRDYPVTAWSPNGKTLLAECDGAIWEANMR